MISVNARVLVGGRGRCGAIDRTTCPGGVPRRLRLFRTRHYSYASVSFLSTLIRAVVSPKTVFTPSAMSNTTEESGGAISGTFSPLDVIQLGLYPVIFLFGLIGNLLVLMVIKGKSRDRKLNDFFILNLALADLTVLTVSIPVDFSLKFRPFPSGILLCKVLWPLMTIGFFASIFTLTVMALERWRAIAKPLSPRLTTKQVVRVLLLIWAAATLCVAPLIVVAYYDGSYCNEAWPYPYMRRAYTAAFVSLQYFIPLLLISVAYRRIVHRLRWRRNFRTTQLASLTWAEQKRTTENVAVNKNLTTIVVLFAVFMLPKHIVWLWLDFGNAKDFEKIFNNALIFSEMLVYIHSCINPVVYGTILKDYKAGLRRYLRQTIDVFRVSFSSTRVHPKRRAESFMMNALRPTTSLLVTGLSPQMELRHYSSICPPEKPSMV